MSFGSVLLTAKQAQREIEMLWVSCENAARRRNKENGESTIDLFRIYKKSNLN